MQGFMIRSEKPVPTLNLSSKVDMEQLKHRMAVTSQDRNHLYMVTMTKKSFGPMSRADKDALVEYVANVKIIR